MFSINEIEDGGNDEKTVRIIFVDAPGMKQLQANRPEGPDEGRSQKQRTEGERRTGVRTVFAAGRRHVCTTF